MKDILNYENLYAIEEDGRVWSYKSNKYIKQWIGNNGYYMVRLHKNGEQTNKCIHRLLAEAYIENPNNYPTVDHIDRNRLNNSLTNLRWAPVSLQNTNMDRTLLNEISSKRCGSGLVTPLRKVMRIASDGEITIFNSLADAAFDITGSRNSAKICEVCQGRKKSYKGFIFKYVE